MSLDFHIWWRTRIGTGTGRSFGQIAFLSLCIIAIVKCLLEISVEPPSAVSSRLLYECGKSTSSTLGYTIGCKSEHGWRMVGVSEINNPLLYCTFSTTRTSTELQLMIAATEQIANDILLFISRIVAIWYIVHTWYETKRCLVRVQELQYRLMMIFRAVCLRLFHALLMIIITVDVVLCFAVLSGSLCYNSQFSSMCSRGWWSMVFAGETCHHPDPQFVYSFRQQIIIIYV